MPVQPHTAYSRPYFAADPKIRDVAPAILDTLGFGVVIIEADTHRIVYANSKLLDIGGYSCFDGSLIGHTCHKILCPADVGQCPITDKNQPVDNSERIMVRADGSKLSIIKTVVPIELNGRSYLIESIVDNSERRKTQEQLSETNEVLRNEIYERESIQQKIQHQAFHDPLTGLANRLLLIDQINHAAFLAERTGKLLAILFLDLDEFKMINDTMGHSIGDELLIDVSKRLLGAVRKSDAVARIGGDEFVILMENIEDIGAIEHVVQKIINCLNQPFNLNDHEFFITASIGIAVYPTDGETADTLLKNADIAMYKAKEKGRNQCLLCTQDMKTKVQETVKLSNQLYGAMSRNELHLYYQPQIECQTGKIIGLEVLLRWNHPEFGMVPPIKFIPIAEQTGLIVSIGQWVLRTACRQYKAWQDAGVPRLRIAVNLSMRQFQNSNIVRQIEDILSETAMDPGNLELEITESIVMKETGHVIETLSAFKSQGIAISIDDFGTEYSSLNYLKHLPVDKVKIAMPFVQGIGRSDKDEAITKTIIVLGRSLGLRVIAEGVETEKQLAFLKERKCDEVQGFYYFRPMPAEEIEAVLRNQIMIV